MLSEEEKKEMLEDACSLKRREDFRRIKAIKTPPESFDEFLKYLAGAQRVFGDFPVSRRQVITQGNKI